MNNAKRLFTNIIFGFLLVMIWIFPGILHGKEIYDTVKADIPTDCAIDFSKDTPTVGLFLMINGDFTELEQMGVNIHSKIGNIVTVRVPIDMIDTIASLPSVLSCEIAKKAYPNLNVSTPFVRAPLARDFFDANGSGVIVGIVDDAIDITNPDFKYGPNDSRILYLWNQWGTTAPSPGPYNYGTEYTKDGIDNGSANLVDYFNHGTMVAGVAAGSGRNNTAGVPDSAYAGIAYGANIISVWARQGTDSSLNMFAADFILDGITYIVDKANNLNMPCVINVSLSLKSGPRDGTSLIEAAIDSLLANHTGKGLAIVVAAGNGGYDPNNPDVIYQDSVGFEWAKNKSHNVFYGSDTLFVEVGASPNNDDYVAIDIWYRGNDTCLVTIKPPNTPHDPIFGPYGPGYGTGGPGHGYGSSVGLFSIHNEHWGAGLTRDPWPNTSDNVIRIILAEKATDGSIFPLIPGVWQIKILNYGGTSRWDAYLINQNHTPSGYISFFQTWTNSGKVEEPGCANNVITVGSFNTKQNWYNWDNNYVPDPGNPEFMEAGYTVGDISFFSSEGPTRDGRPKPDIYAPGAWIATTYSASSMWHLFDEWRMADDSSHIYSMGTSLAAPHVTGTIALMLEMNDTLSFSTIKDILVQTATIDGYLDAYKAVASLGCVPGDANGDLVVDILDVTYLVDSLYLAGPPPHPYEICSGDADCNCIVNILDITYIISYLYLGGPAPGSQKHWLDACGEPLRKE